MLIGLVVWVVVCILVGGLLLVQHLVALPAPATSDKYLATAVAGIRPGHAGLWRVVHVMYRSCKCSQRTIAHLRATRRPDLTDELVLMVDDHGAIGPEDVALRAAGFPVDVITPDVLHQRFHVEAAPLMIVARPDHELAYVGGYSRHKQSAAYEDLSILSELRAGVEQGPLPIFGCATSAQLANTLDPLGLRRW